MQPPLPSSQINTTPSLILGIALLPPLFILSMSLFFRNPPTSVRCGVLTSSAGANSGRPTLMPELSAGDLRARFGCVVEERARARCLSARSGVAWASAWKPEAQPEAPLRSDALAAALHKGQSFPPRCRPSTVTGRATKRGPCYCCRGSSSRSTCPTCACRTRTAPRAGKSGDILIKA